MPGIHDNQIRAHFGNDLLVESFEGLDRFDQELLNLEQGQGGLRFFAVAPALPLSSLVTVPLRVQQRQPGQQDRVEPVGLGVFGVVGPQVGRALRPEQGACVRRRDPLTLGGDVAGAAGTGKVVRSWLLENCSWIYRIGANPGMPRGGIVPPSPVLAPESALGSRPRVALSSAQAPPGYRGQ